MRKWLVRIEPRAKRELERTLRWYAVRSPTAAGLFREEVAKILERLSCFPYSAPEATSGRRRAHLGRFPIGIDYRVTVKHVEVISVTHDRKYPESD